MKNSLVLLCVHSASAVVVVVVVVIVMKCAFSAPLLE
jgi:hypothetical protein